MAVASDKWSIELRRPCQGVDAGLLCRHLPEMLGLLRVDRPRINAARPGIVPRIRIEIGGRCDVAMLEIEAAYPFELRRRRRPGRRRGSLRRRLPREARVSLLVEGFDELLGRNVPLQPGLHGAGAEREGPDAV